MRRLLVVLGLVVACGVGEAQTLLPGEAAKPGQGDTGGVHAPTEKLERGRVVFVTSSCHFCHGVDLTQTAMGAANLMHSPMVGADTDGNIIGTIVHAGLPALQTSMPSYAQMTEQQVLDLAAYVHYLRELGRYKELMASELPAGDAAAGKVAFGKGCTGCHAAGSLAGVGPGASAKEVAGKVLMPAGLGPEGDGVRAKGASEHQRFTENAWGHDLADLVAYLITTK